MIRKEYGRWLRIASHTLVFGLPVVVFLYEAGVQSGLWDVVSGRNQVSDVWIRLASTGYPEVFVWRGHDGFLETYDFLLRHTSNQKIKEYHRLGKIPDLMARVGEPIHPDLGELPDNWPDLRYVPPTMPVVFFYDYPQLGGDSAISKVHVDQVQRACSVGEIRQWLDESRRNERFFIGSLIVFLLSISVLVLDRMKHHSSKSNGPPGSKSSEEPNSDGEDSSVDGKTVYQVLDSLHAQSEQMRWTRLNTLLALNSILLVAWAVVFGVESVPYKWILLAVLALFGMVLSVLWSFAGRRSSVYVKSFKDLAIRMEKRFPGTLPRPYHQIENVLDSWKRKRWSFLTASKWLVTWVPIIFAVIFSGLFVAVLTVWKGI